jgi:hypothetical protein
MGIAAVHEDLSNRGSHPSFAAGLSPFELPPQVTEQEEVTPHDIG